MRRRSEGVLVSCAVAGKGRRGEEEEVERVALKEVPRRGTWNCTSLSTDILTLSELPQVNAITSNLLPPPWTLEGHALYYSLAAGWNMPRTNKMYTATGTQGLGTGQGEIPIENPFPVVPVAGSHLGRQPQPATNQPTHYHQHNHHQSGHLQSPTGRRASRERGETEGKECYAN